MYAYLQKDNFLGDGISPTFYYSSPSLIRPSISQHFFTTVISTKMGKSLANSTFFSSPFFSFPINITEVWLAFPDTCVEMCTYSNTVPVEQYYKHDCNVA